MNHSMPSNVHCLLINGNENYGDVIEFGLPLPKGQFRQNQLALLDDQGRVLNAHVCATSFWPDKTLRWCRVSMATAGLTLPAKVYPTAVAQLDGIEQKTPVIQRTEQTLDITTDHYRYQFNTSELSTFSVFERSGEQLLGGRAIGLVPPEGQIAVGNVDYVSHRSEYLASGALLTKVTLAGTFDTKSELEPPRFKLTVKFHHNSDRIDASLQLHNPRAAQHIEGTWDLGDPNSLLFDSLHLSWFADQLNQLRCADEQDQTPPITADQSLTVYHESSGGEAWNSPVHVNAQQQLPMRFQGYRLTTDNRTTTGTRIQPVISARCRGSAIQLGIQQFWQQFPSAITISQQHLELGLFPAEFPDRYELQGGERKTFHFSLCLSSLDDGAERQSLVLPIVQLNPTWLARCHTLPWLTDAVTDSRLQAVINQGLFGEHSLLAKREKADQYGWRHFGELYADHEAEGHDGDELFISHYNNQYDPIYGLLTQSFIHQSAELKLQADELASHVVDIDIYHTDQDKNEYNHGLFWHTDHYQQAKTCTHRTYSKLHRNDVYADHVGGGGPGGQHCYTTGLTLHYLLAGDDDAKQAVLKLGEWISNVYEGQGTFVELLLAWKNRFRPDIKNLLTGLYPLDRGTGNYIIALLDCYTLTEQSRYLSNVAAIIRDTVHPCDIIAERNFDDVEETWFYTVFLQAVGRYLWVKAERLELDDDFIYARDALLHYADWMVTHENLSLDHPERLEFPTLTWTAQDLRKVAVLYMAHYFAPEPQPRYVEQAEQWYQQICQGLEQDRTRTHTRVLAILMQNNGAREWVQQASRQPFPPRGNHGKPRAQSKLAQIVTVSRQVLKTLMRFSLQREIDQINRRFPQLAERWRR
ncbi:RIFT barrel domain-containing protein [Neiella marina]|nr:hypothetical protein [Neiella marina]